MTTDIFFSFFYSKLKKTDLEIIPTYIIQNKHDMFL